MSVHLLRFTSLSYPLLYATWDLTGWRAWYTLCCLMFSCYFIYFLCLVTLYLCLSLSYSSFKTKVGHDMLKDTLFPDAPCMGSLSFFHLPFTSNASLCDCTWQTAVWVHNYLSVTPLEHKLPEITDQILPILVCLLPCLKWPLPLLLTLGKFIEIYLLWVANRLLSSPSEIS